LRAPETSRSGKPKRYSLPSDMRDASPLALLCRFLLVDCGHCLLFSSLP
jgi:hypothetical protein